MKMGRVGPPPEPRRRPQAGKSGDPRSQNADMSDEFDRYYPDWKGAKVRFVKLLRSSPPMLQPHRNKKFLRLKHLLSQLKNMPAPLMIFRLLKKM